MVIETGDLNLAVEGGCKTVFKKEAPCTHMEVHGEPVLGTRCPPCGGTGPLLLFLLNT